jgi:hypothetical protein
MFVRASQETFYVSATRFVTKVHYIILYYRYIDVNIIRPVIYLKDNGHQQQHQYGL